MLAYAEAQVRDWFQYHMVTDSLMPALAVAAVWADDSVPVQQPSYISQVLMRKLPEYVPPDQRREQKYNARFRMTDQDVPDKIVLSSGNDPHGLWALVDVTSYCGHAGIGGSEIVTLMRHHPSEVTEKQLVEGTTVLAHNPAVIALKIVWRDRDSWRNVKADATETICLVLSDSGEGVNAGGLETDASFAYLRVGRDGKSARLVLREATSFVLDGESLHEGPEPAEGDRVVKLQADYRTAAGSARRTLRAAHRAAASAEHSRAPRGPGCRRVIGVRQLYSPIHHFLGTCCPRPPECRSTAPTERRPGRPSTRSTAPRWPVESRVPMRSEQECNRSHSSSHHECVLGSTRHEPMPDVLASATQRASEQHAQS